LDVFGPLNKYSQRLFNLIFCLPKIWPVATVHHGGKRAAHAFRELYDYYGKRIDYLYYDVCGEQFPSRWPSEISQDDELGWKNKEGAIC